MKLRHIFITFRDNFDEFEAMFNHNVEHINWYLSRKIRTINLELPYEFNSLGIRPTFSNNQHCKIIPEKSLSISYTVEENLKEKLLKSTNDKERCEIYLSLLERGYRIACKEYDIPIDELLSIHRQFRLDNYKTEWIHKKLFIKEHQIKVVFRCCFTSYNFTFNMDLFEYANSSLKGTTIIWETPPHYLCFYKDIRKVIRKDDTIIINNFLDRPHIEICIDSLISESPVITYVYGARIHEPEFIKKLASSYTFEDEKKHTIG